MIQHAHHDLIIAWAKGAQIQIRVSKERWMDCSDPGWARGLTYRIKPEPKPDVVGYIRACAPQDPGPHTTKAWSFCSFQKSGQDNIKCTFDGETGELKSVEKI